MYIELFDVGLTAFDSILAVAFFLGYNRYRIKERTGIIILGPILFLLEYIFNQANFDLVAITASILISFVLMQVLKFNNNTKLKCFWCCILYYGTLIFVNTFIFTLTKIFTRSSIHGIMQEFEIYVGTCLLAKSIMLFLTKVYISIESKTYVQKNNQGILSFLIIALYNIGLISCFMYMSIEYTVLEHGYIIILVLVGIFISELIQYYLYFKITKMSRYKLLTLMQKQKYDFDEKLYLERKEQVEVISRTKHDLKNHMINLAHYIKTNQNDKAITYLEKLNVFMDNGKKYIFLQNDTLEFLLNWKVEFVKNKYPNADIVMNIENLSNYVLDEFDMCILICNLFDNAIEAEAKVKDKEIIIACYKYSGYVMFSFKNRIEKSILKSNGGLFSTKMEKEQHGYGLKQVKDIVKKYGGYVDIYEKDMLFCVNVFIPVKQIVPQ